MRRLTFWPAVLPFLAAIAIAGAQSAPGWAGEPRSFILAASEGYGVQDCLGGEGDCGQVVADAWCEAHGRGPALSFGKTDDVTGSIAVSTAPKGPGGAYFITCGE
jgi:hypothetical protein